MVATILVSGSVSACMSTMAERDEAAFWTRTFTGPLATSAEAIDRFEARSSEATTAWLEESFSAASGAAAIVLGVHADMFEFDFNMFGEERWLRHSGFRTFGRALGKAAAAFGKPVLLVYGDSHVFRVTRPFRKTAPNLTALEVFGAKDMHAVEVTVDTSTPGAFGVTPLLNPALTR